MQIAHRIVVCFEQQYKVQTFRAKHISMVIWALLTFWQSSFLFKRALWVEINIQSALGVDKVWTVKCARSKYIVCDKWTSVSYFLPFLLRAIFFKFKIGPTKVQHKYLRVRKGTCTFINRSIVYTNVFNVDFFLFFKILVTYIFHVRHLFLISKFQQFLSVTWLHNIYTVWTESNWSQRARANSSDSMLYAAYTLFTTAYLTKIHGWRIYIDRISPMLS